MGYEESINFALDAGAYGRVKILAAEADAEIEQLRKALQMMLDDAAHLAGFSERTEKAVKEVLKND